MENVNYPEKLVFGLDIGTRSIVGTVGYREDKKFIVVAQCVREHETRAMIDGQIHDINKVSETIREVKAELEAQLGITLTEVCIAAAGRVLKTVKVTAEYEFTSETTINEDHIRSLDLMGVEKAYTTLREDLKKDKINFYCVGYSVINYSLNGYTIYKLNGHKANRIAAEILATFLPDEVINGLYAAVESVNLQVASLTLEPIAAINVAIPENYRLLNIAMVDVGAGTSDISITKDGSIIAYGMIPNAGDEITEAIAEKYLVDFAVAEKIKTSCLKKKTVSFKNIMGISYKLSTEEVLETVSDIVHKITKSIADRIYKLNGDKSVSAVFVVGGGGKIPGFITNLAEYLKLPQERVALRGEDVLHSVTFLQKNIKKDSLLVTPIGICLNYYDQNNNFIFVTVNGERVKLYDNGKLSISDAAVQLGYSNDLLFPRRGKPLNFTLDGSKRTLKGGLGEAARILLNGETVGITHQIMHNDVIEIIVSTAGDEAQYEIRQLPEFKNTITFQVNGSQVQCPKLVTANGELVSEFYNIHENDDINIVNYYTLKQILEFMDLTFEGEILINDQTSEMDHKIYENDRIQFNLNKPTETIDFRMNANTEPVSEDNDTNMDDEDVAFRRDDKDVAFKTDNEDLTFKADYQDIVVDTNYKSIASVTKSTDAGASVQWMNPTTSTQYTSGQDIASDWFIMKPTNTSAKQTNNDSIHSFKTDTAIQGNPEDSVDIWQLELTKQKEQLMRSSKNDIKNNAKNDWKSDEKQDNTPVRSAVNHNSNQSQDIFITVNGKVVKMSNKSNYIYVDILDYYPFDLSSMKGSELVTLLNGERVDFTAPLMDSDKIDIYWKN